MVAGVVALREALRARGGELVVRQGPLAPTLLDLAAEVGCSEVVAEEEVEYRCAFQSIRSYDDGGDMSFCAERRGLTIC